MTANLLYVHRKKKKKNTNTEGLMLTPVYTNSSKLVSKFALVTPQALNVKGGIKETRFRKTQQVIHSYRRPTITAFLCRVSWVSETKIQILSNKDTRMCAQPPQAPGLQACNQMYLFFTYDMDAHKLQTALYTCLF